MTELTQQLVDGLGRGSEYALLALGIAVIFGVMHLVNFAHGETISVAAYVTYWLFTIGATWWVYIPAIIGAAVITSVAIEFLAFRWVRGAPDFTMLLTSFGVVFVVQAFYVMFVGPNVRNFDRPDWVLNTVEIGGIRFEVFDLVVIGTTAVTLIATLYLIRHTMFGIALRSAAEDFDTARLMGIRSNWVIRGAFAFAGLLAGIAAIFFLMRTGRASPTIGLTPMLKGVLAALIGGLGSLGGAVIGGFTLGVVEVLLLANLPDAWVGLTNGIVFILIALLFIFRPQGIINRAPRGARLMSDAALRRFVAPLGGGLALSLLLIGGGLLYTSSGGTSRENLITQMLINAIVVVGIQVYIGNTGVLSFGHVGFGALAGYVFAIFAISPERKDLLIPDAPFGLADVDVSILTATTVAILVVILAGVIVGLGLARSGAKSGAVAATVITLALLFLVHEVAVNWPELTGGDRGGLSFLPGRSLRDPHRHLRGPDRVCDRRPALRRIQHRPPGAGPRAKTTSPRVRWESIPSCRAWLRWSSPLPSWRWGPHSVSTSSARSLRSSSSSTTPLLTLVMLIVGGRNSVTGALLGVVLITAGTELTRQLSGPDVNIDSLDWLLTAGLTEMFLGVAMLGFMIFKSQGLLDDWELDRWLADRWRRGRESEPKPPQPVPKSEASLDVEDITVNFGGFRALSDANLNAGAAEIVGLIGPNGAGKTTLLNVVTGIVEPSQGNFHIDTVDLTDLPTHRIARDGLVRTFQNLRLFPALTVRENVEIAALGAGRYRERDLPGADSLLELTGLWEQRYRRARELDYGNARRLELARAAAAGPDFLLLDEPTSGMSDSESLEMIDQVRGVAEVVGAGVVVIDHDLGFITGICDRIYCLDQGRVISVGTPAEIQLDPKVQAAYLGS